MRKTLAAAAILGLALAGAASTDAQAVSKRTTISAVKTNQLAWPPRRITSSSALHTRSTDRRIAPEKCDAECLRHKIIPAPTDRRGPQIITEGVRLNVAHSFGKKATVKPGFFVKKKLGAVSAPRLDVAVEAHHSGSSGYS